MNQIQKEHTIKKKEKNQSNRICANGMRIRRLLNNPISCYRNDKYVKFIQHNVKNVNVKWMLEVRDRRFETQGKTLKKNTLKSNFQLQTSKILNRYYMLDVGGWRIRVKLRRKYPRVQLPTSNLEYQNIIKSLKKGTKKWKMHQKP